MLLPFCQVWSLDKHLVQRLFKIELPGMQKTRHNDNDALLLR